MRNLINEFKSSKLTNNVSNNDFVYIVFNIIMSYYFGKESLSEVNKENLSI